MSESDNMPRVEECKGDFRVVIPCGCGRALSFPTRCVAATDSVVACPSCGVLWIYARQEDELWECAKVRTYML